ncbi:MAG TPA: glycosyl hydrolase family 79 C-terminal domain-containing protein [Solirubrobacteraceae bacterium]
MLTLLLSALVALSLPRRAASAPHTPEGRSRLSVRARPATGAPATRKPLAPRPGDRTHVPAALGVRVETAHPGAVLTPEFPGLSLETPALASPAVTSGAPVLANLLREVGGGIVRVSGDSVDYTQWLPAPGPALGWAAATIAPGDLERLAALTRASGWRLILGLNLGHPLIASIVEEARGAASLLGPSLGGLAIGNEPDIFTKAAPQPFRSLLGPSPLRAPGWGLPEYLTESARVRAALAAAGVSAPIYGPETATGGWLGAYAAAEHTGLAALTPHLYPLIRCRAGRVLAHGPSAASLLSRGVAAHEARQIAGFMQASGSTGLPVRIDETNSVACGGQPHVSDTFAAALWALDYSLIAASHGVAGLNFHGGLGSCAKGGGILSPWYSPLCTLPGGQLSARPEFYALLALRSLEGSTFVPVAYRTPADVSVYALRAPDGTLRVVIDDMRTRAPARRHRRRPPPPGPLSVTLRVDPAYRSATVMRLLAPALTATRGVTLGGATLRLDGTLPQPLSTPLAGGAGSFTVRTTPASAAIVTLPAG